MRTRPWQSRESWRLMKRKSILNLLNLSPLKSDLRYQASQALRNKDR